MVAQAVLSSFDSAATDSPIKLLDLLTNRYHVGLARESSDGNLDIEMPASSHLVPGQRVRFIVGDHPLVARHNMRRGFITHIFSKQSNHLRVRLTMLPETAVA